MGIQGEGTIVLKSTQRLLTAAIASTATIVAKIVASQFAAVNSLNDLPYHITWVPGAQSTGGFTLVQTTSTATLDPANAAVKDSMTVFTTAGQSWNYDAWMKIGPLDNLCVFMPNSSGAVGVAVKIYAEPLI